MPATRPPTYGDAPRYIAGPLVDRISIEAKKKASGQIESLKVRVHLTDRIVSSSVAAGAVISVPGVKAELESDSTILWEVPPTGWESLEVAVTDQLKSYGWGDTPVLPIPAWALKIYPIAESTSAKPVIIRTSLADLSAFLAGIPSSGTAVKSLYELDSLYLAASTTSRSKLLLNFHALPFVEPSSGLIFSRARWYDPSTGTFLTPDPQSYADSSNLYAFAGADPVNNADPTGECIFGWGGTCSEWAAAGKARLDAGTQWVDQHTGYGFFGTSANFLIGTAAGVVDTFLLDPLRFGEATGEAIGGGADALDMTVAVVQDVGRGAAIAAGAGTAIKAAARGIKGTVQSGRAIVAAYNRSILSSERGAVGAAIKNVAKAETRALSRGEELRQKYSHYTAAQRRARIDELAMGNRVLREAGVPRQYISEALQSFEPGTLGFRIAGESEFGLRFYGGPARPKSPYLSPTFPLGPVRQLSAPYPGNTLQKLIQWRIRPGTPLLHGRIRANFGQPGGGLQVYVPDFQNNLITP